MQVLKNAEEMAKTQREDYAAHVQEQQQRHNVALAQAEAFQEHLRLRHVRQKELWLQSIVSVVLARKSFNLTLDILAGWLACIVRRKTHHKRLMASISRDIIHRLRAVLLRWFVYRGRQRKRSWITASANHKRVCWCCSAVMQAWLGYRIWKRKRALIGASVTARKRSLCLRRAMRMLMSVQMWRRKSVLMLRAFKQGKSVQILFTILSLWSRYFFIKRKRILLRDSTQRSKARETASRVAHLWRTWAGQERCRRKSLALRDSRSVSAWRRQLAARFVEAWRCSKSRKKRVRGIMTWRIGQRRRLELLRAVAAWSRHSGAIKQAHKGLALKHQRLSRAVCHALNRRVVRMWQIIASSRAWCRAAAARACGARRRLATEEVFACWLTLAAHHFGLIANLEEDVLNSSRENGVSVSRGFHGGEGTPKGQREETGHGVKSCKVASAVQSSWALVGAAALGCKRDAVLRLHYLAARVDIINHQLFINCLRGWVQRAKIARRSYLLRQCSCQRLLASAVLSWYARSMSLKGRRAAAEELWERHNLWNVADMFGCWAHNLVITSLSSAESLMDRIVLRQRRSNVLIRWWEKAQRQTRKRAVLKRQLECLAFRRAAMAMAQFKGRLHEQKSRSAVMQRVHKLSCQSATGLAFHYIHLWSQARQCREAHVRAAIAGASTKIERYAAAAAVNARNVQLRALGVWQRVYAENYFDRLSELRVARTSGRLAHRHQHCLNDYAFITWINAAGHQKQLRQKHRRAEVSVTLKRLTRGFCGMDLYRIRQTAVRVRSAKCRSAMLSQSFAALVSVVCAIQQQRRSTREEHVRGLRHERRRVLALQARVHDAWHRYASISAGLFCRILGLFFHIDKSLLTLTHTSATLRSLHARVRALHAFCRVRGLESWQAVCSSGVNTCWWARRAG